MTTEYINTSKFEQLAPVLEDCAQWYGHIALCVAYLEEGGTNTTINSPISFRQWILSVAQDKDYDKNVVADISYIYNDMIDAGEDIVEQIQSKSKPDLEQFENFNALYNGFIARLRGLEKGSFLSSSGICPETGFRSKDLIAQEQKKEMERLKRQGTSFSLVMARIDNFKDTNEENVLAIAVETLKSCMRSFDDAYYLKDGYFLLSLKQTDIIGAEAATDRLQIVIHENSGDADITLSYCIAEPVEDDEINKLMQEMRKDLDDHDSQKNVSLKFVEQSPLQQYLESLNG